jgi:hypothetical protein
MFKSMAASFLASALALNAASAQSFAVTSPEIKPGGRIADEQAFNRYGCTGKNISPALNWSGAPTAAKSFALMVHDSDAPVAGGFWHWVVFNISADAQGLAKGAGDPKSNAAPPGATQGRNDFGAQGYGGPCPPSGDAPHHYHFMLFALDAEKLAIDPTATGAVVAAKLRVHTIAKTEFVGLYGR